MPNIEIGRYEHPESVGFLGWIKCDKWCAFVALDGSLLTLHGDKYI